VAESSAEIVRRFCAAWEGDAVDAAAIAAFFTDDGIYHNMPLDPIVGPAGVQAFVESFTAGVQRMEFRIKNVVADGDVVLTERVDVFVYPHTTVELPVMGTFELRDGKIAAWRDYFDIGQFTKQLEGPAS